MAFRLVGLYTNNTLSRKNLDHCLMKNRYPNIFLVNVIYTNFMQSLLFEYLDLKFILVLIYPCTTSFSYSFSPIFLRYSFSFCFLLVCFFFNFCQKRVFFLLSSYTFSENKTVHVEWLRKNSM